ncbi:MULTISPECIES: hypothetical protein [Haloferacaceae]|uniref:Uncharacterized protein n=1 Tax=Halorubrum glutamatedens TaxID=2707018 RepID=A0ABD5QTD5_9EURY|nr:hypothetical protein [Halobellus captivus]
MDQSDERGLSNSPNDDGSTERTIGYSYGGEYVINSSASPGAWITSTHTVLDIDQVSEQEVSG